jgi:TonB family protein
LEAVTTRVREVALPVAFAASVAIHVSTLAALIGFDGGLRAKAPAVGETVPTVLEAKLVTRAPENPPVPEPPAVAPRIAPLDAAAAAAPPTAAAAPVAMPSRDAGAGKQSPFGWAPRIVVNDRVPRALFGEALEGDVLAGFPIEIDVAVGIPDRIEIPYPQAALAARLGGNVLAWIVIDANGAVEAVHVVEGEPVFAEVIETTLARTRFTPARNLGRTIRYYITVEFEFRIEPTGAAVAAGSVPAARR